MESILARALEYTLKYWLKSFSREQFKLQGRTVHLSNLGEYLKSNYPNSNSDLNSSFISFSFSPTLTLLLSDIDGDALHSSVGLPPALNVATAKVGKLEITVELDLLA